MQQNPFTTLPLKSMRTLDMQQGDVLFCQDQKTFGMFKVISGRVTLRRTTPDGAALILHRAAAGGYFAEASVFSEKYHCDAVCIQAGQLLRFDRSEIAKMLSSDPKFSEGFSRLLAAQVQQYRAHIELLAIRPAKERVLAAMRAGYLETTVAEFASQIDLTHEACYRALRLLCKERRILQIGRGKYVLGT